MEQKDRYIRFDWAAKRLLRNKANFGVLEGFLTVLLGENIRILEILESESNQLSPEDKFNRVDIKARNSKDEIIIVEIQNTREIYYLERILYGVAKTITEHIGLGRIYSDVKKVYSISILYFDIGQGNDYLYHGQNTFVGVHTGDFLQVTTKEKGVIVRKLPAEIFPEYFLIRVNEFNKSAVTPLEEWIEYLKTGIIRPDTKAPGLEEARRKLIYYNLEPAERQAYDRHIDAIMIQNDVLGTAREEGLQEGREESKITIARNMKNVLNLPDETIAQISGLPIDEIKKTIREGDKRWENGEGRGERRKRENMRDKSLYRPRGKYEKVL